MDLQKAFNFDEKNERADALLKALAVYGMPDWSVEVIVLLARDGRPREIAGQTVLDPFFGCGTTLEAAKALGRRAIGFECEERWCEMAANGCRQGMLDFAS